MLMLKSFRYITILLILLLQANAEPQCKKLTLTTSHQILRSVIPSDTGDERPVNETCYSFRLNGEIKKVILSRIKFGSPILNGDNEDCNAWASEVPYSGGLFRRTCLRAGQPYVSEKPTDVTTTLYIYLRHPWSLEFHVEEDICYGPCTWEPAECSLARKAPRCDGKCHCKTWCSDEWNCPGKCNSDKTILLSCKDDESCYNISSRCNGKRDCKSGVDELDCSHRVCNSRNATFLCDDGLCVYEDRRCNGIRDCAGGEDEISCPIMTRRVIISLCVATILSFLVIISVLAYFNQRFKEEQRARHRRRRERYISPIEQVMQHFLQTVGAPPSYIQTMQMSMPPRVAVAGRQMDQDPAVVIPSVSVPGDPPPTYNITIQNTFLSVHLRRALANRRESAADALPLIEEDSDSDTSFDHFPGTELEMTGSHDDGLSSSRQPEETSLSVDEHVLAIEHRQPTIVVVESDDDNRVSPPPSYSLHS